MRSPDLTELWTATFDETVVITVDGHDARLERLMATVPFDPGVVIVDRCPRGYDSYAHRPETNHHVLVGNRHKKIVEAAAKQGLKNVFVFEDDAEFTGHDAETLAQVLTWARGHADEWDVFYLGFAAPLLSRCSRIDDHIIRVHRPFFAHALCYSQRAFDPILSIDFTADHRPLFFRAMERLASPHGRRDDYFRQGVGSLDTWLSFSQLGRLASDPILVVQTSLPPGTEDAWRKRTGRSYDVSRTPQELVTIALRVHRVRSLASWAAVAALLILAASRC